MPICPKCGVYVRKSRWKQHLRMCGGWPTGYPPRHLRVSVSSYSAVEKAKKRKAAKR